jgi:hypothetical protein
MKINGLEDGEGGCVCVRVCVRLESFYDDFSE